MTISVRESQASIVRSNLRVFRLLVPDPLPTTQLNESCNILNGEEDANTEGRCEAASKGRSGQGSAPLVRLRSFAVPAVLRWIPSRDWNRAAGLYD